MIWMATSSIPNHPIVYVTWPIEPEATALKYDNFVELVCVLYQSGVLLDAWWRGTQRGKTQSIIITTINPMHVTPQSINTTPQPVVISPTVRPAIQITQSSVFVNPMTPKAPSIKRQGVPHPASSRRVTFVDPFISPPTPGTPMSPKLTCQLNKLNVSVKSILKKEDIGHFKSFSVLRDANHVTYTQGRITTLNREVISVKGLITNRQICTQNAMHKFNQSGLKILWYSATTNPAVIMDAFPIGSTSLYDLLFQPHFDRYFNNVLNQIVLSLLYMNIYLGIAHNNLNSRSIYVYGNENIIIPYFDMAGDHPPPNHDTGVLHLGDYEKLIHDVRAIVHDGVKQGDIAEGGKVNERVNKLPHELDAIYMNVHSHLPKNIELYEAVYNTWKQST